MFRAAIVLLSASAVTAQSVMTDRHEVLAARLSATHSVSLEAARKIVADTTASFAEPHRQLAAAEFGYDCANAPPNWSTLDASYSVCASGIQQSPINFPVQAATGSALTTSKSNPVASFLFPKASTYTASISHGAPVYTCSTAGNCGYILWGGLQYQLIQAHFHAPSEHQINGLAYAMDVHMVHQHAASGKYLVYGVVFDGAAASDSTATKMLDTMWAYMPFTAKNPGATSSMTLDLTAFTNSSSGYFTYQGSFTTPPCTEGVTWIQQATPVSAKQSQVDTFFNYIGGFPGNARPPQPLNPATPPAVPRTIGYYVD